uniref:Odorant receptor n=1 Tax=Campoletis chlorideae TaxID=219166 RepID=A0A346D3X9_9HYME|nr:odorant receptor [Campoletis chlorideae]
MEVLSAQGAPNEKRVPNKDWKMDVNRTLQYTRWTLEILGVWALVKKNPKKWEIYGSRILTMMYSMLIVSITIPCTIHLIFKEKDIVERVETCGPIAFSITNLLKYYSIIYRRKMIKRCIEHVEDDWMEIVTKNDREIMRKRVSFGIDVTIVCAVFMYGGGLLYNMILPLSHGNGINEFNETVRPLAYPGYDIFGNPQISPTYEIIFYSNFFSSCIMYTVTTASCNLAAIFVTHTCGQIEIMMSRLETIFQKTDDDKEILENRIDLIVKSHIRVLRLTSMIEMMLREICFVEVTASLVVICVVEYYCVKKWNDGETVGIITYVALLISMIFNVFVFCQFGELLKEQCYQIGRAVYMIDWYRLPGKTGVSLVMIIAMANCPRRLTAGKIMELSMNSFGDILKTSFAYLNMLRTVAD